MELTNCRCIKDPREVPFERMTAYLGTEFGLTQYQHYMMAQSVCELHPLVYGDEIRNTVR